MWAIAFAAVSALHVARAEAFSVRHGVISAVVIVIVAALALLVRRPWFPDAFVAWAFALALAAVSVQFQWDYLEHGHPTELALSVLVIACIGPLTAAWLPFAAAMVVVLAFPLLAVGPDDLGALLAAGGMTAILMGVRIRSLNRQADITLMANRLATTDVVTGLLNMNGLQRTLPRLEATARRLVQPVMVMCLDLTPREVTSFDGAQHQAALRTVASVITGTVRADDLVARVSEHVFLVIGLGTRGDGSSMAGRVVAALQAAGVDHDEWSGQVRHSIVSDLLNLTELSTLMAAAQAEVRGGSAPST